jgi:PAS domain S-box-containing protein
MNESPAPIRVLHVDDDPEFADLTATVLERENAHFSVETATDARDGLERLTAAPFDCIVSDYDMPRQNGIEFLEAVRDDYPDLPFILYTGKGSEEIASDAISAGVTDYLQKEGGTGQYAVLANRIENAVDQYRAQAALEASQQRLSLFIDQSPLGVVEWDDNFEFVRLNDAAEEMLGYAESELKGESWEKIVPESDRDEVGAVVAELLDAEGGFHSVNENVRADGERIVCEWHNRVVTDADRDTVAIFSQFQEITDRKEYERELEQYESYLEGSTDIITVLDESGTIRYQSPSVTRILGYEPGELVGQNGFEFVHPDDEEEVYEIFSGLLAEPGETATIECRFQTADDEWRWLEIRGTNQLDHPEINGIVTNNRDITERKRREQELEQTNVLLSTLVETLPVGILAEDSSRNVLAANERLFELFELSDSPDEVTGANCERLADEVADMFAEPDAFVARINELVANPESVHSEMLSLRDGRTFARSHEPIELPGGAGHLWVYRDVTDRKQREGQLQRQNERLNEFASVVSHDLRNPLNVAQSRIELVQQESDSDHLDAAMDALSRSQSLIDDLRTLAREGEDVGELEPVALSRLVENCWRNVDTADATLTTEITQTVRADRGRLQQLVENLVRNAIEHGGTSVTVTVGKLAGGFYVEDDGVGIPNEERDVVFDAGHSTAADGTGFGLSIVNQVAEAHGWEVAVVDGTDGGARFEITGVEFAE